MAAPPAISDPARVLALAYVRSADRPALATLFALDERLAAIHAATRDPHIGLLRLAWWRDALDALDRTAPPGEPLLRSIAAAAMPSMRGSELAELVGGWMALLEGPMDAEALATHAAWRGGRLFALAARLLGAGDVPELVRAGEVWALVDIAGRLDREHAATASAMARDRVGIGQSGRWPVAARPLGMLVSLAVADARDVRSSPSGRLLRMLAHRVTGRTGLGVMPAAQ